MASKELDEQKEESCCIHFPEEMLMESLLLQCKAFNRLQKYEKAINSGVECIEKAVKLKNAYVEIEAALELWTAFRLLHRDDSAEKRFKEKCVTFVKQSGNPELKQGGCQISEDDDDVNVEMKVHFTIILNAVNNGSHLEQSAWHGKKCIEIAQEIGNKSVEMHAYLLLAKACYELHLYELAIMNSKKCVEKQETLGNPEIVIEVYLILESAYFNLSEYDSAINFGSKCFELAQSMNCSIAIQSCVLLVKMYYLIEAEEEFFQCTKQLSNVASMIDDQEIQKYIYFMVEISCCYMFNKLGQYEKAISHNRKACDLVEGTEAINDPALLTEAYMNMFRLHMLMNQTEEGESFLVIAARSFEEILDGEKRKEALKYIAFMLSAIKIQLFLKGKKTSRFTDFWLLLQLFAPKNHPAKLYCIQPPPDIICFNVIYPREKLFNLLSFYHSKNLSFDLFKSIVQAGVPFFMKMYESETIDIIHALVNCGSVVKGREIALRYAKVLHEDDYHLLMNAVLCNELAFQKAIREFRKHKSIDQDVNDFFKDFCEFNKGEINGQMFTVKGMLSSMTMRSELAEENLKNAVMCFENVLGSFREEKNQISLQEGYIQAYKLLSKVEVEMGHTKNALLTTDLCRSKALNYQLTKRLKSAGHAPISQEVTLEQIASFVEVEDCAIILYSWFFNNLYIFCVRNVKGDNGEDMIHVDCHVERIDEERRKYLGLQPTTTQSVLTNMTNCEEEQQSGELGRHFEICCEKERGQPSENDDVQAQSFVSGQQNPTEDLTLLKKLHKALLSPFFSKINANNIIIVPEGQLYSVPFVALQDPTTECYPSEHKRVRYSPSISSLIIHKRVPGEYYARSGSLIIGNPSVDQIEGINPLPGSEMEAIEITKIIGGVTPIIGPRATKAFVLERLFEVCIIHFACHISLNPSAIILSPQGSLKPGDDSHLLKPDDVIQKDVHARLVVLSGCDSGRGKICAEGVVGIARAFLAAGAATVLVSLWRVPDQSTCEFMATFYTYLLDWKVRRSASESLHLTINDMRRKYPDEPIKWSGFYLMGDDVIIDRESLSVLQAEADSTASCRREPCETDE